MNPHQPRTIFLMAFPTPPVWGTLCQIKSINAFIDEAIGEKLKQGAIQ